MDFQKAKDKTLWRLAITHGACNNRWTCGQKVWRNTGIACAFCDMVKEKLGRPLTKNLSLDECLLHCPAVSLCGLWVHSENRYYRFSLEGLHFFYDKLLALPMPQPKEATNGK